MFCKNCGSEVSPNEKYCSSCGCQLTEEVSPVNGDSNDSKNAVNKKSSGLKKSSKIIIASVLAVVLLSGIAAAGIRLGVKMANKPAENGGSVSASDSDDISSPNGSQSANKIRTFNSLLEDDNYWVPVKVEHISHSSQDSDDLITEYKYDWYVDEVTIEITFNSADQKPSSCIIAFDNDGKILSERSSGETSADITYEYENGLLSKVRNSIKSNNYDFKSYNYDIDFSRDSKGRITNQSTKGLPFIEFKYDSENECSICAIENSNPVFLAEYKYDNNDGISLVLSDFEILDEEWAEEEDVGIIFDEPYPVINLDTNDKGMITRFSTNSMSSTYEDNYSYKTTESGYYSEYKVSYDDGGYDIYKVYWERGTKTQERTGLYYSFCDVVVDLFNGQLHSLDAEVVFFAQLFACGESAFN